MRKLLLCVIVALTVGSIAGCNDSAIDTSSSTSKAAERWIHLCDGAACKGMLLDRSRFRVVDGSQQANAVVWLDAKPWTQLTEADAAKLVGSQIQQASNTKPYLLRAIDSPAVQSAFRIAITSHGDVLVASGALSRHPLPIQRKGIVAWLDQPPRQLYVSFSVAE